MKITLEITFGNRAKTSPRGVVKAFGHVVRCIARASRHPRIARHGASEYRSDLTMGFDDDNLQEAYDSGRELAHIATRRHYDQAA